MNQSCTILLCRFSMGLERIGSMLGPLELLVVGLICVGFVLIVTAAIMHLSITNKRRT